MKSLNCSSCVSSLSLTIEWIVGHLSLTSVVSLIPWVECFNAWEEGYDFPPKLEHAGKNTKPITIL